MTAVPMTRAELLAYVAENFQPTDIWPDAYIFDAQWDVFAYAEDEGGYLDPDTTQVVPTDRAGQKELVSELISEFDLDERAGLFGLDDPGYLEDYADKMGLTLVDVREQEYQHDTQGHGGAVAYCTIGLCSGGV